MLKRAHLKFMAAAAMAHMACAHGAIIHDPANEHLLASWGQGLDPANYPAHLIQPAPLLETRSDNWEFNEISLEWGRVIRPFWILNRWDGQELSEGKVGLASENGTFHFHSIWLYSSIHAVPYSMTGKLEGIEVFKFSGVLPWPQGEFVKVSNPFSSAHIDGLEISLFNSAVCDRCSFASNPIGYRDIAVTTAIPEPASLLLTGIGITVVARQRKWSL